MRDSTPPLPRGPVCALCGAEGPWPWTSSPFCDRCTADVIDGFRRRYEAALRLCPIGSGPRDPLSEVAA